MIRKLSFLLSLCCIAFAGHSQNIQLEWNNDLDKPVQALNFYIGEFIGTEQGGATYFAGKELVKLDKDNHIVARKEAVVEGGKFRSSVKFYLLDNRLWMVKTIFDKDTKTTTCNAQELNRTDLSETGKLKILSEISGKGNFAETIIAPIGSNVLFMIGGNFNQAEGTYFKVVNANMDVVRGKTSFDFKSPPAFTYISYLDKLVGTEYSSRSFGMGKMDYVYLTSLVYDSLGNVFIDLIYDPGTASGNPVGNFVYIYDKTAIKPRKIRIDANDMPACTYITSNTATELICTGFYRKTGDVLPTGITYKKLSVSGAMLDSHNKNLSETTLTGLFATAVETRPLLSEPINHAYYVHPPLPGSHSDIYLSFEHAQYRAGNIAQVAKPSDPSASDVLASGNYDLEIVAVHLSEKGEIIWEKSIPRRLEITGGGDIRYRPGSFTQTVVNDVYYAFYNDKPENITVEKLENMKTVYPEMNKAKLIPLQKDLAGLAAASIGKQGGLKRTLVAGFDKPFAIHPSESIVRSPGEIIITGYNYGYKTDEKRLVKLGTIKIR